MSQIRCQVESIAPLTETTFRVDMTPDISFDFQAGQYLLVHMGENDARPFSIANPAYDNNRLELHIGAVPGNTFATEVIDRMRQEKAVYVSGGHGDAYLQSNDKPLILVAGGTGFSYAYSILKQTLKQYPSKPVTLYWGAKRAEDIYYLKELTELAIEEHAFTFIPVVETPTSDWQGKTGWVHKAVMQDLPDMSGVQVYIAGRFEMAKVARDDFFKQGLSTEDLFGDAYAYI